VSATSSAATATPIPEGRAWALVAHQRRDVIALRLEEARGILEGRVRDWSEVGGAPGAIAVYLPAEDERDLERTLGSVVGQRLPAAALLETVAREPGALGVVRADQIAPGVLPLVVEGYDPLRNPASASPIRLEGHLPPYDPVLLVALGEVIPARCVHATLEALGGGEPYGGVRVLLEGADIAVTSLDASLSAAAPPTPCVQTFVLQGTPRAAGAMAEAGIDVVFANGNHIMDCWTACPRTQALRDTLAALRGAGLATAGAGETEIEARRPAILETADGTRFAFVAYDGVSPGNWAGASYPGTAPLRREAVIEDVRAARALADVVVVGLSMGEEYSYDPTPNQRDLARAAIEAGATLVLGNHPHVPQTIELRAGTEARDALAGYGLGNFLFDQTWSAETMQSLLLEVGFAEGRLIGYRLRPVVNRGAVAFPTRPEVLAAHDPLGRAILERAWAAQDRLPR